MSWYEKLVDNAPLSNLCFLIVLAVGLWVYLELPRARDPEINFNWVNIWTAYPGATAEDVEREVTSPLEDALRTIPDIRYVVSSSREGRSSILVRFARIDARTFDKRINDVRREILNRAASELPEEARTPNIVEITSSNGFPTAMLALYGPVGGEVLRAQTFALKRALERVEGVDRVLTIGFQEPEIHVEFDPFALAAQGLAPTQLADQIGAWYRDVVAGRFLAAGREFLARFQGRSEEPQEIAELPLALASRTVPLKELAKVRLTTERPESLARYRGQPAVLLSITKKANANTLDLVARLERFAAERNPILQTLGLKLALVDDQTDETRRALKIMESNALLGFGLVLGLVGIFLGWRLGLLVALGLPFALAGAFIGVALGGSTLNLSVLLGVVIALGMLVDDAVVIVEAVYDKLVQGLPPRQAVFRGVQEVGAPVLASVLTTVAAFLPLMLLPGVLGEFLKIVPMVVTVALGVSLIEAFWMLPSHILAMSSAFDAQPRSWRERMARRLRRIYGKLLVRSFRRPGWTAGWLALLLAAAGALLALGRIPVQFFAFDTMRLFYLHVDLPVGTPLAQTLETVEEARRRVEAIIPESALRAATAVAGIKFTQVEPLYGEHLGQVIVSLWPRAENEPTTEEWVDRLRPKLEELAKQAKISFLIVQGGPPAERPINVKVKSEDLLQLDAAVTQVRQILAAIPGVRDISDDRSPGRPTLTFRLDREALARSGVDAREVWRTVRLLGEGEWIGATRRGGEALDLILRASPKAFADPYDWLRLKVVSRDGRGIPLGALVHAELSPQEGYIRHYQFVRAVTVEADIDRARINPEQANAKLLAAWQQVAARYPNVELDLTGELDDIRESLSALRRIFLLGVALIYLILAAQFRSYFQPLLVLTALPLAIAGVLLGLVVSGLPLSLYTLYGVVALTGIAVNSAIVLVAAANDRIALGMSPLHAAIYAARRRLIPILITSGTTIAGLLSLALGVGGQSLLWGPVASSIVWGLGFSTLLTLWVMPLLLRLSLRR
ncbi:efflux RND transporter permease subunit [Methylothermus subterraneus]